MFERAPRQRKHSVHLLDEPAGMSAEALAAGWAEPADAGASLPDGLNAILATGGRTLDAQTRATVEPRLGFDFGQVRIFPEGHAARSAQMMGAEAYTVGPNIVFGPGRYAPTTGTGQRLLAHELAHVVQQASGPVHGEPLAPGVSVSTPGDAFEQAADGAAERALAPSSPGQPISLLPDLRPAPAASHPESSLVLQAFWGFPTLGLPAQTPYDLAEDVWKSLLAFSARATPDLQRVGGRITDYLARYDAAYATFAATLKEAEEEAAASDKWAGIMMGIAIGTGVGLAAGALYEATTMVGKIVYEAGGEGVEAILGGVAPSASHADFTPPADLNNDKVARGYFEKIFRAWEAVGVMQAAALAFSPRRDALKAESASGKPAAPDLAGVLQRLQAGLDSADRALTAFLTTADAPLLDRSQQTVEQDIWISWMSRAPANGRAALGDGPIGRRMRELHIFGRLAPEGGALNETSQLAQEEQVRMQQIGQTGVVIVPPTHSAQKGKTTPGVIRFRHDAYGAVGRVDPNPGGAEEYAKVAWQPETYMQTGEVVLVRSTAVPSLDVQRLGPTLPVAPDERAAAFKMLGISQAEHWPEMAEALWGSVNMAVGYVQQEDAYKYSTADRPAPPTLTRSEDGILVSEASGRKLVLFTLPDASDLIGVLLRKDRVGAPKVVAINLNPKEPVEEFRLGDLVWITNHSEAWLLADEIRAVRDKGKQPAKP